MGKQPTIGQKKSKEQIAKAAASVRGKKKKWGGGKVKEKLNNKVLITADVLKNMERDIPRMKNISIFAICEKFNVIGGVARQVLRHLAAQRKIAKLDSANQSCPLYTGLEFKEKVEGEEDKKEKKPAKPAK